MYAKLFCLLYEGILSAIRDFAAKCNFLLVQRFRILQTKVWFVLHKGNKLVQSTLLMSDTLPTALHKWNILFENLDWKRIFCFCSTFSDFKLRWFQTRLLHCLLPTRKFLYDRKIINDPVCPYCCQDVQTIQHLFWDCTVAQTFWNELKQVLLEKCNHNSNLFLSEELILFAVVWM
eukprot:TRINITY_DN25204_c0_g1_i1.p1 TRINITY_DN25204_c0_g1~~TRINITY_DN25204_c0_g1_i1.p1  ORF type:complete len:176 (+),score=9.11 TRINITY_DN25204_c0_g1_i1:364-891(+)